MNSVDIQNPQRAECLRFVVSVIPSKIKHPCTGLGLFMNLPVDAGKLSDITMVR